MKRNTLVQESLKNLVAVLFAVAVILPSSVFAEDADPCGLNPSLNFKRIKGAMMKTSIFKKMAFALLFVLMFSSMSFATNGDLGGETYDGSSSKPYQISDAADLNAFAKLVNDGVQTGASAVLTQDIDMNQGKTVLDGNGDLYNNGEGLETWTPIGTDDAKYTGTFDGNGHTIRGLYFNDEKTFCVGLFGYINESAKVQNVGVVDSYFKGLQYVGGVVGFSFNGTVSNAYNTGSVSGSGDDVGGVVGYNGEGTVSNVYNTGSVSGGYSEVGGVVGYNDGGTVSNVYNTGSVNGTGGSVGGVVGYNVDGSVSNVYNTGSVSGDSEVGGVVGGNYSGGTVSNVYNTGSVNGTHGYVGGVVGFNYYGTVSNVYNTGSVNGTDGYVGGVVGGMDGGDINKAYYDNQTCNNCNSYGTGKPLAELATLTIGSKADADADFPLLEGEMESPWAKGIYYDKATGKLANSELPYLKSLPKPQDVEMEFNVKDNVIQISSAEDLKNFAKLVNEYHITDVDAELTTNLTVNSNLLGEGNKNVEDDGTFNWEAYRTAHNWNEPESWSPIGTDEHPYTGTFDGNGYTIRGLYFNDEKTFCVGLFGYINESAKVQNVGVVDSYFNGSENIGGVVGYNDGGTVSNVYNTGSVNGTGGSVGGVVGASCGTVSNVYNTGSVSGDYEVGGVVGYNDGGSVSNVYNTGSVSGTGIHVGGVVGNNFGTVSNAYNTGSVSGSDDDVGGVVGYSFNGTVSNVYNTGSVSGNGVGVGGVVGNNYGTVSNAYYNTDFYAGNAVGGGDASGENVEGKTTLELASKTLPDGFDENVWVAGSISIGDDGSVTFGLPYLNGQSSQLTFKLEMDVNKYLEISTALQLKLFAQLVNSGEASINGKLTADICLNACNKGDKPLLEQIAGLGENGDISTLGFNQWTPMNVKRGVQVTFDGNGRTISGLYFNNENDNCVGLFGEVTGALSISDLGIKDSYFKGKSYVGGLVGENYEGTLTVTNSYNAGTVSGVFGYVGGLVGDNGGELTITNSYNAGTVSGRYYVGGLVGFSSGILTFTNSYNAGAVSGSGDDGGDDVGGVVGFNNKGTVSNVYNTGSVRGTGIHVGGVVGFNNKGTVSNAYNTGSVSGSGNDVGGVVGDNYGTVSNVYNTGSVSGDSKVGGVVGLNDGTVRNGFFNTEVTCENCYVVDGTTGKLSGEFADGTVAMLLHDWCEMDGETCKEGGLNGSIWGQDLAAENSLPDFSGVVGFKYGSITFFNLNDDVADSASIDATAKAPVSIPKDIAVSKHVTFKRSFAVGYSTMMLPFSVNAENKPAELEFYSFDKVEENNGKYTASYNPVNASSGLNAHTPYIVKNSGKDALSQVTFEGEFTLGTSVMPPPNSSSSAWKFNGTYEYKTWEEGDAGLGRTYGFAGSTGNDPDIVGKFAKVGAGAYIYPMRAYLEYTAPAPAGRPAANGVAANTVASLPDEIEVVIVDKDETTGEQTTRVIGKLDTRTGEFKFANDRWFDLQGRYLGNKKPTQKGAYYNNGKKVIVK